MNAPMRRVIRSLARLQSWALVASLAAALGGCLDVEGAADYVGMCCGGGLAAAPRPQLVQVFIASTRKGESGPTAETASTDGTHFALASLTLPPSHQSGTIETPSWGSADSEKHIVLAGQRQLDSDEFRAELASHISGRIGVNRDILVFVHGFNNSFAEVRMRAAQIAADSRFGGVPILFTWPSKNELFGYVADKDSAMASRDALEELLERVAATPGVGKVHILAHSMGGWLTMEALRQASLSGHRDLDGHLGEVMLANPDIDMDVFATQMARIAPANVTVFATANDRALSLSSVIAQSRQRVGAINPKNAEDKARLESLGAKVYDLSAFSDGFIDHGAYAAAPDVLHAIGAQMATPRAAETNTVSIIDASGYVDKPAN
jgi:esterase/lipase superfamily enzyme